MKSFLSIVVIFIVSYSVIHAQSGSTDPNPTLASIVPPSPNAASLSKFGDVPVGYSTGIPEVNVPIFSYKNADGSLALNVSLDYHAGGVKVGDIASNVGLGWALNAGGVITRTMRGISDEIMSIGFSNTATLLDEHEGNRYAVSQYMQIAADAYDGQADVFNFNFGGRSGKFMFGKNNDFLMLSPSKIKVEKELDLTAHPYHIKKFTLTDEKGVQYIFDAMETSTTGSNSNPYHVFISAWYLTKIIAPFNTDFITIEYESELYSYEGIGTYSAVVSLNPSTFPSSPYSGQIFGIEINGKRIKSINLPDNTTLTYTYSSTARADLGYLGNQVWAYPLTKITIANGASSRGYNLYHDYSTGNRLTLLSVKPFNSSGEDAGYSFEYNLPLPTSRLSRQQDHWGYYNVNGPDDLFPVEYIPDIFIPGSSVALPGGNREVDLDRVKYGSLTKMIYPTGGYTVFEMEANQAKDDRTDKNVEIKITRFDNSRSIYTTTSGQSSENFTFNGDPNTNTSFKVKFFPGGYSCPGSTCNLEVDIVNSSNTVVRHEVIPFSSLTTEIEHDFSVYNLPTGNYTWRTYTNGVLDFADYVSIEWTEIRDINYETQIQHIYKPYVGGLRVKSIKDYDNISSNTVSSREYEYLKEDGVTSSGGLGSYPTYSYTLYYDTRNDCSPPYPHLDPLDYRSYELMGPHNVIIRNSSPVQALAMTNGSPVNYSRVVEKFFNNGLSNGKIVRYFSSYQTQPLSDQSGAPYIPLENVEYGYGQLTKELIFDKDEQILKETKNEYLISEDQYYNTPSRVDNFKSLSLLPVRIIYDAATCPSLIPFHSWAEFLWFDYYLSKSYTPSSHRKDLSKTTITENTPQGSLVSVIDYSYDNAFNLRSTVTTNSKDEQIESKTYFAGDYTNTVATSLIQNNMYAIPISGEKWLTRNSTNFLLGGYVNEYSSVTSGIRKNKAYLYQSSAPLASSNVPAFNPANFNRSSTIFKEALNFNHYTSKGFVSEQAAKNNIISSYIWNYNKQFPIAQVTNATQDKIAYTSFETTDLGGWTMNSGSITTDNAGITGKSNFSGTLSKSFS